MSTRVTAMARLQAGRPRQGTAVGTRTRIGLSVALFPILITSCGRLGFDAEDHRVQGVDAPTLGDDAPGGADGATDATIEDLIAVCQTSCPFSTIQPAIDQAIVRSNPAGLPIVIEVQDSGTYVGNLSITPLASGAPLTLRAKAGDWPVLVGSGGSGAANLSIAAPDVTVSGFTFKGTAQRGISVTSPAVMIDHNFFTADFSAWNSDQFFRGTAILLWVAGTDGARVFNNTFYDPQEAISVLDASAAGNIITLRNNLFVQLTQNRPDYEPIMWFKPSLGFYSVNSDYNLFYYTGSECLAWDDTSGPITTLANWKIAGQDANGISSDPLLANPAAYDFHERSTGGRYQSGAWVIDATKSPAIDAGDSTPVGAETVPNGGVINIGGYGGTQQASRS